MLRLKLIKQLKKINKTQKFYLIFFTEKKLCFVLLEVLNNYLIPFQNMNRSRTLILDGNLTADFEISWSHLLGI